MKTYEITLIVRPDLDDEQTRNVTDGILSRIEGYGGEVIASFTWSPPRRRLAYPIRDFGDGYYFTADFNFDGQHFGELDNLLKLNDSVLRFLIVDATDLMVRQAQQRMQQAMAPPPQPQPAATPPGPAAGPQATPAVAPQEGVPAPSAVEAAPVEEVVVVAAPVEEVVVAEPVPDDTVVEDMVSADAAPEDVAVEAVPEPAAVVVTEAPVETGE